MIDLLNSILDDVDARGGALPEDQAVAYREQYQTLLTQAELESPPPPEPEGTGIKKEAASNGLSI